VSNREAGSRVVWLDDEQVYGEIVGGLGAFFTTIKYTNGGIEYEVLMENDEFTLLEDLIEYDSDD
jgi:hypothetical protein